MPSRRDYIEEIVLKHSRLSKRRGIKKQFEHRLHKVVAGYRLVMGLKPRNPVHLELMKYAPVGYVACLEGYLRLCLKALIDSGEPYVGRIEGIDGLRFDCRTVLAITENKVSLGQYVSHVATLNSLSDINKIFSVILDEDFIKAVKSIDYIILADGKRLQLRTPSFGDSEYPALEELFRLRNIFAHELAPRESVKPNTIRSCISAAASFYMSCDSLFQTKIPGKV
jgi:hypothetical protein